MPGPILGAVPDAAMNAAFPLAVYAAVSKKLNQPLEFPGDITSWQANQSTSSAMMNAYMEEWAVLLGPQDQKYNTCDSSAFAWEKCWPRIAGWYGIEWTGPQKDEDCKAVETAFVPRGYGPKGVTRRKFSTAEWAKRDDVKKAWAELAEEHGLTQKEIQDVDRVFGESRCLIHPLQRSVLMESRLPRRDVVPTLGSELQHGQVSQAGMARLRRLERVVLGSLRRPGQAEDDPAGAEGQGQLQLSRDASAIYTMHLGALILVVAMPHSFESHIHTSFNATNTPNRRRQSTLKNPKPIIS